jgi:hypothetical protein
MLNLTKFRPSFKQGKGAAVTPPKSHIMITDAASAVSKGGAVPLSQVANRLGFKRNQKIGKPKFEFQETLKQATVAEVAEQHGLMKTVADRVYNQMGLSVRMHEAARSTLLWLNQFREFLNDEDEQAIVGRLTVRLGDLVEEFFRIRTEKIELARELEEALTATKRNTRLAVARKKAQEETALREKGVNSLLPEEDHPSTSKPEVALDPKLVLKQITDEILGSEAAKKAVKKAKKKVVEPDEDETL